MPAKAVLSERSAPSPLARRECSRASPSGVRVASSLALSSPFKVMGNACCSTICLNTTAEDMTAGCAS